MVQIYKMQSPPSINRMRSLYVGTGQHISSCYINGKPSQYSSKRRRNDNSLNGISSRHTQTHTPLRLTLSSLFLFVSALCRHSDARGWNWHGYLYSQSALHLCTGSAVNHPLYSQSINLWASWGQIWVSESEALTWFPLRFPEANEKGQLFVWFFYPSFPLSFFLLVFLSQIGRASCRERV